MHDAVRYLKAVLDDKEKLCEYEKILCKTLSLVEVQCPAIITGMLVKMHVLAYGHTFDEELADKVVADMVNVDGTKGAHWTRQESDSLADRENVTDKNLFYVLINMFASDYQHIIGNNDDLYAKMAKAAIEDPDGKPDKWLMMYLWSR